MIYIASIADCTEEMLSPYVCEERRAYAAKYKQEPDRIRSLGVAVLLGVAMQREFGNPDGKEGASNPCIVPLTHDEHGKPVIIPTDGWGKINCHFSLAHAGDYVAAVIDRLPVGIDIERIRTFKESLTNRFFSEEEQAYLKEPPNEIDERFTQIWTLKESYLKVTGLGLGFGVGSFFVKRTDEDPNLFIYEENNAPTPYYGYILPSPKGYALSVCFEKDQIDLKDKGDFVNEICLPALLQ